MIEELEVLLSIEALFLLILALGFILTSLLVLTAKRLNIIIVSVGLGSVVLSIMFFILGAPFAGAFELSVGAGLISVLFIIATSLTEKKRKLK